MHYSKSILDCLEFWDTNGWHISTSRPDLVIVNKKRNIWLIVDFLLTADYTGKLKEREKIDKYLELARKLKKIREHEDKCVINSNWDIRYIHLRIAKKTGGLKIKGRVKTIWTTSLLWLARIQRRVLDTWGYLLSLKSQCKAISQRRCEKVSRSKIIIITMNRRTILGYVTKERKLWIICECCKITHKKYKTRNDWVGKMIHWKLCQILNFDYTNNWCMHKQKFVVENETHNILWNFKTQTDHLILERRSDQALINKKKTFTLHSLPFLRTINLKWSGLLVGPGHISPRRVALYTDQFRYVLVSVSVGQGHPTWIPRFRYSSCPH